MLQSLAHAVCVLQFFLPLSLKAFRFEIFLVFLLSVKSHRILLQQFPADLSAFLCRSNTYSPPESAFSLGTSLCSQVAHPPASRLMSPLPGSISVPLRHLCISRCSQNCFPIMCAGYPMCTTAAVKPVQSLPIQVLDSHAGPKQSTRKTRSCGKERKSFSC